MSKEASDGSTASYYELPKGAGQLQHLISHRNMNAQIGEIFRACYRYGMASHSDMLRDAKKIKFYAEAEITRLENLAKQEKQTEGIVRKLTAEELAREEEAIRRAMNSKPGFCSHGVQPWYNCQVCRPDLSQKSGTFRNFNGDKQ